MRRSAWIAGLCWVAMSPIVAAEQFPEMDYADYEVVGIFGDRLIVNSNDRQFLCGLKQEWVYAKPWGCSPFATSNEISEYDLSLAEAARLEAEAAAAQAQAQAETQAIAAAADAAKVEAEFANAKAMAAVPEEAMNEALGEISGVSDGQLADILSEAMRANDCNIFVSGVTMMAPATLDLIGQRIGLSEPLTHAQRNAVRVRMVRSTKALVKSKKVAFSKDKTTITLLECN